MSADSQHDIACALDQRTAWIDEHGPEADIRELADRIRVHCGHTAFKAWRLAHGWRRVEDAVAAFHQWCQDHGLRRSGMDARSWRNWEAGARPGPLYLDQLSRFFRTNAVALGVVPDYSPPPAPSNTVTGQVLPLRPEEVVAECARESARYGALLDTPIGSYTMDELTAAIQHVAEQYPHEPVLPSLLRARELRQRAWFLKERCQNPEQLRELHRVAGWTSAILANASFDLGGFSEACTQCRVADLHAELAGDSELRCWIHGMMSLIAYWDGRPADAVAYAETAKTFGTTQGTALERAASLRARGFSHLGHAEEVDAALREVESLREDTTRIDVLPGLFAFPAAKSLYWSGSAQLGVGDTQRGRLAEGAAAQAIELYEQPPPQERRLGELSHSRLDLVTARLFAGEADGLEEGIQEVLTTVSRRRVESVIRRLLQLARLLDQPSLRTIPALLQVRDRILDQVRYSPAPDLPGGESNT